MRISGIWFLSFLMVATAACGDTGSGEGKQETSEMKISQESTEAMDDTAETEVGRLVLDRDNLELHTLPGELYEISGLAMSPDGRLFGHNDEYGVVYQIDPDSGGVVKRFTVGKAGLEDDFEGIAIVGERFYLVNSSGDLFEFREGADREHVEFTRTKTGLKRKNDVEGLCYDPAMNALLLVCKEHPGKGFDRDDQKTIYAFSLERMELEPEPRFVLDARSIREQLDLKDFKPSGIERDPVTGSLLVVSSREPSLVRIDKDGNLLAIGTIDHPDLTQPEGIAFARDGRFIISSEGAKLLLGSLLTEERK